jgi:hypothetical protein
MNAFETTAAELDRASKALAGIAALAAPRLEGVISAQHRAGLAPDGSAWSPDASGGVARLADLGAPVVVASGAALTVTLPDAFLPHQAGSARLPRRQSLPMPGEDLPGAYRGAIDAAAQRVLEGA